MSEPVLQAEWLNDPACAAVLDALEAEGGAGCVRFVGGCVRNTLMGLPVSDLDLATTLEPPRVIAAVEGAGLRAIPTGVEHGTVTVISRHRPFEVTTLRRDVETDGRRAVVAFTQDWAEDAQRRDFRLNALYADRAGQVFDPTGGGVADARAGRIVFVGDAEQRIREDYLRILRFFRFQAWYGREEADAVGLEACRALRGGLSSLSKERVTQEMLKLLAAPDPTPAVASMVDAGVWTALVDSPANVARLERAALASHEPILRLAALTDEAHVEAVIAALRLSNAEADRLGAALAPSPQARMDLDDRTLRREVHVQGRRAFLDRAVLAWAQGEQPIEALAALAARVETEPERRFPVTGEHLKAMGLDPSPRMGEVLRAVEAWWIAHDFDDEGARAFAAQTVSSS
ncbi:CCA tRNA nucleotidyltransferase [Brevundimonas sp. 2R-24]|uniref:CCA tRNA nucleotidyltransferase n=1 Tax=Peiella sedimenti TaxID=3061083 RepID=A0ABT8SI73_9CAUL|nr:CCA tRNA nucleotidyltransferase [Caulobacteraceae bacterium XZ-24]